MSKIIQKDIFGEALLDYQSGNFTENIKTISSIAGEDLMELPWLFRTFDEMPIIEQTALILCKGYTLDVGCGTGAHTLYLQENDFKTKAIDISKGAIETCVKRGVKNASVQNIWKLENEKFDTILILMNGTGLCGKLNNLSFFLSHLKTLLNPNGQILIDSSDIAYMFEDEGGNTNIPESKNYYGEVIFEFQYKNKYSNKFDWLFVDADQLKFHALQVGLNFEMAEKGCHHDYLARLTLT